MTGPLKSTGRVPVSDLPESVKTWAEQAIFDAISIASSKLGVAGFSSKAQYRVIQEDPLIPTLMKTRNPHACTYY